MGADKRDVWHPAECAQRGSTTGNATTAQTSVFADLSGRRRRLMRRAGICVAAALIGCLTVVAVGLLGGPRAPFVPWAPVTAGHARAPGRAGAAPASPSPPAPRPARRPPPSPPPDPS